MFYPIIAKWCQALLALLLSIIRESLKTSVFRDLPLKNARFAAQRARNCKGTSETTGF
jgi:hypothetical protein